MKIEEIELNREFNINNQFPSGNLKDYTRLKLDEHRHIRIFFRDMKKWVNPPTDSNQESQIIRAIEKHGIIYIKPINHDTKN